MTSLLVIASEVIGRVERACEVTGLVDTLLEVISIVVAARTPEVIAEAEILAAIKEPQLNPPWPI